MTLLQPPSPSSHAEAGAAPSPAAVWSRIADDLAAAIGRGEFQAGQRLPPEHALAERYGVNRHTLRRAIASVCQRGVLRAAQGSGTFVQAHAVELLLSKRTRHRQNLALSGLRGGLRVVAHEVVGATAALAKRLEVAPRRRLLRLWVLGEAEGQVISVSERFFPATRFARMVELVEAHASISEAFRQHGVLDYTRRESHISAELPTPLVAAHLRMAPSQPVLRVDSVNVDTAGVPIEAATAWFAADRVTLTVKHDEPAD